MTYAEYIDHLNTSMILIGLETNQLYLMPIWLGYGYV